MSRSVGSQTRRSRAGRRGGRPGPCAARTPLGLTAPARSSVLCKQLNSSLDLSRFRTMCDRQLVATDSSPHAAHVHVAAQESTTIDPNRERSVRASAMSAGITCSTLGGLTTSTGCRRPCDRERQVSRGPSGLASTSARCAARASQRASEVRPRTVGSPVDVLGPDELARRFMRAHGGARRDLLRSWRAWPSTFDVRPRAG